MNEDFRAIGNDWAADELRTRLRALERDVRGGLVTTQEATYTARRIIQSWFAEQSRPSLSANPSL